MRPTPSLTLSLSLLALAVASPARAQTAHIQAELRGQFDASARKLVALAEAMGRPLGTVKSDVHRGVRLLREAYVNEMNDDSHEVA